jgi:hypothetical protein
MIQPLETSSFIASDRTTYQEIGKVIEGPDELVGTLVYFDSWLAKKYPVTGEIDKFVWFVKYEDLVAYEPLPE